MRGPAAAAGSHPPAWNAGAGASRAAKAQQVKSQKRRKPVGVQVNLPGDLGAEESREALEEDGPGGINSTGRPGKLGSLCEEDKGKVARLIRQVVDLGGEVKETRSKLESALEHAEAKASEAEAAVEAQEALAKDNARLQSNLAQALRLLRAYQERAEASSAPPTEQQTFRQGSAQAPPQAPDTRAPGESSSPAHDTAARGTQSSEEVSPEPHHGAAAPKAEDMLTPNAPFSVMTVRPEETVRVAPQDPDDGSGRRSRWTQPSGSVPYNLLPWDQEMFSGVPVGFRVPGVESVEYAPVLGSPRARVLRFDPALGENGAFYFVNASRETSPGQLSDASPGLGALAAGSRGYEGGAAAWSEAARELQQDEGRPEEPAERPLMPSETGPHQGNKQQPDQAGSGELSAPGQHSLRQPPEHGREQQGAVLPLQGGSAPSASMASTEVAMSPSHKPAEEATPASRPVPEARPHGAEPPRPESIAPVPSAADSGSPAATEEVAEGEALSGRGDVDRSESIIEAMDDTIDLARGSSDADDLDQSRRGVDDEIVAVSVVGSTRAETPTGRSVGRQREEPPPSQGREADADRTTNASTASAAAHPLEPSESTPWAAAATVVPAYGGQSSSVTAAQDNRKRDRSFAASESGGGVSPRLAPSDDGPSGAASRVPSSLSSRGTAHQSILRDFDDSLLDLVGEVESMHLRASLDAVNQPPSASKVAPLQYGTPRSSSAAADRGSSLFPAWSATPTPARAAGPSIKHFERPSPHQIPSVGMREENDILAAIADAEDLIQSLELQTFRESNSAGTRSSRSQQASE